MNKFNSSRIILLTVCFLLLSLIYIGQRFNYLEYFTSFFGEHTYHDYTYFIFNKSFRFLLNDSIMVLVIWLIFKQKSYIKLALLVEGFGLFVMLPLYFSLKLNLEGTAEISSPLLSFIHRLIINPTLMILLIPALYYQDHQNKTTPEQSS